jgi:hypothetical protein
MAFLGGLFGGGNTANATLKVNYNGKDAESGLKSLGNTIKTVVTVAAIKMVADYGAQLAKLGANAELVEKNFANMAEQQGRSTTQMMTKMRSATKGMIDDVALQQKAMQAMVSGVNFDDLVVAMEFVTNFAAATGTDATQKLTTVVTGMARKSAMFFDDVGIQVMGSKDVVGDAVDQMREKMGQFATSTDDAAVVIAQMQVEIQNLKVEIGKELVPAMLLLAKATSGAVIELKEFLGLQEDTVSKSNKQYNETKRLSSEFKNLETAIKFANEAGNDLVVWQDAFGNFRQERLGVANAELNILKEQLGVQRDLTKEKKTKGGGSGGGGTTPEELESLEKAEYAKWKIVDNISRERSDAEAKAAFDKKKLTEERLQELLQLEVEYQASLQEEKDKAAQVEMDRESETQQNLLVLRQNSFSTMSRLSDLITQKQINDAKLSSSTAEEFEAKMAEINKRSAMRQHAMAVFEQMISLAIAISNVGEAAAKSGASGAKFGVAGAIAGAIGAAAGLAFSISQIRSATIPEPPDTGFELGGLVGGLSRRRGADGSGRVGAGEFVTNAQSTAQNLDLLRSINNNTANMRGAGGGNTYIFNGATTEQVVQIQKNTERRSITGNLI